MKVGLMNDYYGYGEDNSIGTIVGFDGNMVLVSINNEFEEEWFDVKEIFIID